ncbi:hypothetical protein JCM10908_005247 [Rhodotorula pacifica]|uniref:MDR family MFS transporter n=1 Tax=Rhodotorula pacifica TaxID=1495444 RepID=UPI00317109F9
MLSDNMPERNAPDGALVGERRVLPPPTSPSAIDAVIGARPASSNTASANADPSQRDVIEVPPAPESTRSVATLGDDVTAKSIKEGETDELPDFHANGLADQTSYMPVKQILIVFLSLQLAVFLSFLDQTIVSTALPVISAHFDAGRSSSFVGSAYLLTSTAMQPIWGRLSDIFGRKATLLACVVAFIIGSLACAVAQTMLQLIIFRGMQGVGGGGLITLTLIIISDVVSLRDRGKYQGVTEITIAVGNGVGPIIGGVLSQKVSWRWAFWMNLPIGGVCLAIIVLFLPLKAVHGSIKEKLKKIDYGGALLTVAASVLVILPLNWGGTSFPWVSGPVLGCLLSGVAAFGLFFVWEWKVAKIPVVPPYIFKNPTVAAIFLVTLLAGGVILSQIYYLPQYFQIARGASPIRSGVLVIAQFLSTTFFVFVSGQCIARTGEYKPFIVGGYAMWAIGLGLLSTLDEHSSTARVIGYQILNGCGQGQTLQTTMVAAQAAVERSEMSVVTSVRNFMRSLGGTIFLVVGATIINNTLRSQLGQSGFEPSVISAIIDDPTAIWPSSASAKPMLEALSDAERVEIIQAWVRGFRTLMHVLTGLIGANFVVALVFVKRHSLSRADEEALKARGKDWVKHRKEKKEKKGRLQQDGDETPLDDLERADQKAA